MANDYIPRGDAEFNGWLALDSAARAKLGGRIATGAAARLLPCQGLANFVTYANANLAELGLVAGDMRAI